MSIDGFDATFRIQLPRAEAWRRLTDGSGELEPGAHRWLAGFDSQVTVVDAEPNRRLEVTKDEEPCRGTDIVVTFDDDDTGTRIHVVQSRFGDWLADHHEVMAVGWRFIVADLQAHLATGVHPSRHLRPWGDVGADARAADGGLRLAGVRPDGLADRLGLADGDLLVGLAGAPVASLDDLCTVLRVLGDEPIRPLEAEWIRADALITATIGPSD